MLSNKGKYGLKALMYMARFDGPCLAAEIAAQNQIPRKFLDAILLELRNAGILSSKKARGRLSAGAPCRRDHCWPNHPNPRRTARADCLREPYRLPQMHRLSDEDACAVHDLMLDVRDAMALILDRTSIAALSTRGNRDKLALR